MYSLLIVVMLLSPQTGDIIGTAAPYSIDGFTTQTLCEEARSKLKNGASLVQMYTTCLKKREP